LGNNRQNRNWPIEREINGIPNIFHENDKRHHQQWIYFRLDGSAWGRLNVSVRGSGGSTTITLLRQLPNDTTVSALSGLAEMYRLVQQWDITSLSNTDLGPTSNIELITEHPEPERTKYVLGILSGDYGSGTWYLRVGSEKADPWSIA